MKRILFIPLIFCALTVSAQNQNMIDSIPVLQNRISQQESEIKALNQKIENLAKNLNSQNVNLNYQGSEINNLKAGSINHQEKLDSIQGITYTNSTNIKTIANDLGTKIQETQTTANDGLAKLDKNLNQNKLYWIIATLATLLLGGLIYWLLNKRISSNKTDVETQIKNTKKSLEEESLKLDNKLIEVLETQLKISQAEQTISNNTDEEIDHSLALKVADEIVRMQKNITRMDESTKGLKPLVKGIERIQANFAANGYEMVNLLNTEYDDRMNIDVINFIDDDNIEKDKKIITKVIKPQVNYKGVLIQRAQVDVSQN